MGQYVVHVLLILFCKKHVLWLTSVSILLTWCYALCGRSQSVTLTLILLQGEYGSVRQGWGSGMVVVMLTAIKSRPRGRHPKVLFYYVEYAFQNYL